MPSTDRTPRDRATAIGPDADRVLVRAILSGSIPAWHEFVRRYAALIRHVVMRYVRDEDDARAIEVDILEMLYRSKLRSFKGRSLLSTWLVLVTRNYVLDVVRRRVGRQLVPRGLEELDASDRVVFRLHYMEGRDVDEVAHRLSSHGDRCTRADVAEALRRIESAVGDRALRRMLDDLAAQSLGVASRRLLDYLKHARIEEEDRRASDNPEALLLRKEAENTARDVLRYLEGLPEEERRILGFHAEAGWTADRIAEELGLEKRRQVFTALERIRRRVRRAFRERWSWT